MRKIRRRIYVKTGFIIFLLAVFGLYMLHNDGREEIDIGLKIERIERSIRSGLNQGACYHPQLAFDNPEIMKFYKPVSRIQCGNDNEKSLGDWVMCEKSICFVKPEVSSSQGEVVCSYTDLIRKSDFAVKYGKTTKTKEPYVLQESDFVRVSCKADSGQIWYGLAQGIRDGVTVVQRNSILNQPPHPINLISDNDLNDDIENPTYFNVLMFGFDSLSRFAFMRKLPKTYAYLTEELNAIVLLGYNIVGDGTPQALIPLLTGHTELELPEVRKRMPNSQSVDVYPMIWKEYAKYGYVTSYNEDTPNWGVFTYRLNGFGTEQPVHHYLRTYYVEANGYDAEHCIGHQTDHVVMLNYTKNFMAKYDDRPRFVFSFHGGLSHDSINLVGAADDDVHDWLRTLKEKHLLDNSILIMMSDHGNRFSEVRATLQGKQEERLPYFSFSFPASFKARYPLEFNNFKSNAERLTTPFDIHATLQHILKLSMRKDEKFSADVNDAEVGIVNKESSTLQPSRTIFKSLLAKHRAISLFDSIPKNRSCGDAYIEPHWCACLNWQQLPLNNTNSDIDISTNVLLLKLAKSIVQTINNATAGKYRELCIPFVFLNINWALRLQPHNELLQYQGVKDHDGFIPDLGKRTPIDEELYQLQIVVQPGESLFEASVVYNKHTTIATTKLSEISRVNKYGSQARCIHDRNPELRKYCYCRAT